LDPTLARAFFAVFFAPRRDRPAFDGRLGFDFLPGIFDFDREDALLFVRRFRGALAFFFGEGLFDFLEAVFFLAVEALATLFSWPGKSEIVS
jgi:hypothetical protein